MSNDNPDGYYAQFAKLMSALLIVAAAAVLATFVAVMTITIYVVAYVLPVVGVIVLVPGLLALLLGEVGTFLAALLLSAILIGSGGLAYYEWFVRWPGGMVPITQVPSYIAEGIKSVREKW